MKNKTFKLFLLLMIGMGSFITNTSAQDEEVYKVVEEMPRFPGCEMLKANAKVVDECAKKRLLDFIYKNLTYPAEARKQGVEGMSVVQFIIDPNGDVRDIKLVRDPGAGTGEAAVAVVEAMNHMKEKWIPGKQRGRAVNVLYTLPIKFKLENTASSNSNNNDNKGDVTVKGKSLDGTKKDVKKNRHAKVSPFGKKKKTQINPKQMENPNMEVPPPPPPPPMEDSEVFKVVDELPRFFSLICEKSDGDDKAKENCAKSEMLKYIYSNLIYPEDAKKNNAEGMAVVQFTVEGNGTIANTKVLRDPGYGMGDAALTVVNSMKKWIPGKQKGKTVRVLYTLPVKFKTEGNGTLKTKDVNKKKKRGSIFRNKMKKTQVNPKQMEDSMSEVLPPPPPPPAPPVEEMEIFKIVEQMPMFPGCEDMDADNNFKQKCAKEKMFAFISDNLTYPAEAKKANKKGKAIIQFVVSQDGSIINPTLLRDPGMGMGDAALSVVKAMPKWIPGKQRGRNVPVQFTLPVTFK